MTNEIQVAPRPFSLVPSSFDEAVKIAKTLAASDLVPKDYKDKAENVFVAVQWGQEIGLPPLQALQNISVINGRPSIWGDAALALVMAHPAFEDIDEVVVGNGDNAIGKCTVNRKGRSPVVREFSVADAKRAGLWGKTGPWTNYPQRMLQLRARAFALRDAFPDAIKGIGIAEEVQDIVDLNDAPVRQPRKTEEPVDVDVKTGEVIMPEYDAEAFAKNLPKWQTLIESGKKTADQIIATVESKARLTDEQRTTIKNIQTGEVIEQ